MATIMPAGELTRKALAWIAERRAADPCASPQRLVDEAAMRFNLGPLDAEFLCRALAAGPAAPTGAPEPPKD